MASCSAAEGDELREEENLTKLAAARRCRLLVALVSSLVGSSNNDGGGGLAEGENVTWMDFNFSHSLSHSLLLITHQRLSVRSRSVSDA